MNLKRLMTYRRWKVLKRAFHIWQQTPHKVAPMAADFHVCQSCETEYSGNYCPRCGQSSRIGRFSFKTAVLMFLDNWGIGNRGMFRSIRDLMLRPGYMIRDYVSGRQSAYFPPFQMFFILATFSLLLTHGFDLGRMENSGTHIDSSTADSTIVVPVDNDSISICQNDMENDDLASRVSFESKADKFVRLIPKYLMWLDDNYPSLSSFLTLLLMSSPLYLFFRRCPAIPDLRYSEHIVALVFTSNTFILYRIVATLIPFVHLSVLVKLLALYMVFVALKQFTGYSKRRLLLYIFLALILFILFLMAVIAIYLVVLYYFFS